MQPVIEVAISIRLQDGSVVTIWIDPLTPSNHVPQLFSELRDNYGVLRETVPQLSKSRPPLRGGGAGIKGIPAIALPADAGQSSPPLSDRAVAALGGELAGRPSNTTWAEEIVALRDSISRLALQMGQIDSVLAPVLAREAKIKAAILHTHWRNGARLCLERRGERVPHWKELLEISARWGPQRNERRRLNSQIRASEREVGVLERKIAAVSKKQKGRSNVKI